MLELTGVRLGGDLGFSNRAERPLSPMQIRYAEFNDLAVARKSGMLYFKRKPLFQPRA